MKKMTMVAACAGLLALAACSKKKEEGTAQRPGEGTIAATPPPPPKPEPVKPMTGAELAEKYKACVAMIGAGKLEQFTTDCIDDSYVAHDVPSGQTVTGKAGLTDWFKAMKTAFPDFNLAPQIVLINGRNIIAASLSTGTHSGALKMPGMDMPASNKKLGIMMFHRVAINDANKATEEWGYADPQTMMGQLQGGDVRPATDKGLDGAPIVAVAADDAKEKGNVELVTKLVDAQNNRKWADAWAAYAPDAVIVDRSEIKDMSVKELEKSTKDFWSGFPDAKFVIDNTWAAGDFVVTMGKFTGNHTKDSGPLKKTGKKVAIDFAQILKLKDGKITNEWRFVSGLQAGIQLGLVEAPAAPAGAGSAAPAAGSAATAPGATKATKAGDACKADTDCAAISTEGGKCCSGKCVDCFGAGAGTACCKPKQGPPPGAQIEAPEAMAPKNK